jgi:outer membrane receptor for monomeric catechols
VPGADRFWVIDASVGYRIPRRVGRFALEIKNLFDKEFSFQDTDPANPVVRPGRLMVFSFTVGI